MSSKFSRADRTVLNSIEELLWTDWNPIGCGAPRRDEYDSFAMQVYSRAKRGMAAADVADYLSEVETAIMGLCPASGAAAHNLRVANRVIEIVKSRSEDGS